MSRIDLGAKPLIFPMPVLIIGTYDKDGVPNAMNAAWGMISDMNEIVNGRSAHIHAHFARLERNELFFSLRLCIKNSHFAVPFP